MSPSFWKELGPIPLRFSMEPHWHKAQHCEKYSKSFPRMPSTVTPEWNTNVRKLTRRRISFSTLATVCDTGVINLWKGDDLIERAINPLRVFAVRVPIFRLTFRTYSGLLVVERCCPLYGVAQIHLKLHLHSLGCTARLVYLRARAHMVMHALSATYKLCVEAMLVSFMAAAIVFPVA